MNIVYKKKHNPVTTWWFATNRWNCDLWWKMYSGEEWRVPPEKHSTFLGNKIKMRNSLREMVMQACVYLDIYGRRYIWGDLKPQTKTYGKKCDTVYTGTQGYIVFCYTNTAYCILEKSWSNCVTADDYGKFMGGNKIMWAFSMCWNYDSSGKRTINPVLKPFDFCCIVF